jgi:hypothetical protein
MTTVWSGESWLVNDEVLGDFRIVVGAVTSELEFVHLAERDLLFPAYVDVGVIRESWLEVELSIQVLNGLPELVRLEIRKGRDAARNLLPIRARDLRSPSLPPLERLLTRIVQEIGTRAAAESQRHPEPDAGDRTRGERVAAQRRKRHQMNDDLLRRVAEVVTADTTGAPRMALRNEIGCSLRTASRWIALAKERGFLDIEGGAE